MTKPMTDEQLKFFKDEQQFFRNEQERSERQMKEWQSRALKAEDEIRRLREELSEERHFCICGCPMDEHENYGEDGFGCDNPNHECVLVCAAAAEIAKSLREENKRAQKLLQKSLDYIGRTENTLARDVKWEIHARDVKYEIRAFLDGEGK